MMNVIIGPYSPRLWARKQAISRSEYMTGAGGVGSLTGLGGLSMMNLKMSKPSTIVFSFVCFM